MLLRRISPFGTFGQVGREMERLFGEFLPDMEFSVNRAKAFPPLNVWEDGDIFFVEAELPGFKMENIDVEILGNEITLKGKREPENRENVSFHRTERGHGEFTRVLTLPTDVDSNKVEATLRDGVLTIKLPKAEAAKARKIEVKPIE